MDTKTLISIALLGALFLGSIPGLSALSCLSVANAVASASTGIYVASRAVDCNAATSWVAGPPNPANIAVTLTTAFNFKNVVLLVNAAPASTVQYQVYGRVGCGQVLTLLGSNTTLVSQTGTYVWISSPTVMSSDYIFVNATMVSGGSWIGILEIYLP